MGHTISFHPSKISQKFFNSLLYSLKNKAITINNIPYIIDVTGSLNHSCFSFEYLKVLLVSLIVALLYIINKVYKTTIVPLNTELSASPLNKCLKLSLKLSHELNSLVNNSNVPPNNIVEQHNSITLMDNNKSSVTYLLNLNIL